MARCSISGVDMWYFIFWYRVFFWRIFFLFATRFFFPFAVIGLRVTWFIIVLG